LRVEQEIRDIFYHTRELLMAYQEIGLGPPPLPASSLELPGPDKSGLSQIPEHSSATGPHRGRSASLKDLREDLGDCRRCKLHRGRKNLVFGEGSSSAGLVFVGEGPGHDEDLAGRPFVGESGKLLTRIIENAMGLTREDVYICNVVKCHPPKNRDPETDEIEACLPFLKRQLQIINPRVICCLGRVACQTLIRRDFSVTRERGAWHEFTGIPLMPTFHPAYLLRNPSAKRETWEDIKMIMKRMGLEVKTNG